MLRVGTMVDDLQWSLAALLMESNMAVRFIAKIAAVQETIYMAASTFTDYRSS